MLPMYGLFFVSCFFLMKLVSNFTTFTVIDFPVFSYYGGLSAPQPIFFDTNDV